MSKISLFLMTQKGFDVLDAVIQKGYSHLIEKVVIGKDANLQNDFSIAIESLCEGNRIDYYLRNEQFDVQSIYALAVSWRWLITLNDSCRLIVLHDSLLPKYRGFSPLVNQLIKGEGKIGVTALIASDEYDKGDIIAQESIRIKYPIKIQEAIEIITPLYTNIVCNILQKIEDDQPITGMPQIEKEASYSLWRDAGDYKIEWADTAENIKRFIHAVGYPYDGAETLMNGSLIKILDVEVVPDVNIEIRQIGKVIFTDGKYPVVVCGEGLLKITSMQDQSGNSMLPIKKFRSRFE